MFAGVFVVVTVTPVVSLAIRATEPDWYDGPGDVLIVLGGSKLVPGTGPTATLGEDTYVRCVYAASVLRERPFARVIVTGDQGAGEAMAQFLRGQVTPQPQILIENRARSTDENALRTKQLLIANGAANGRLVLLTSDYHAWRARRVFLHAGLAVQVIPVPELVKQANQVLGRWPAFEKLSVELGKDMLYAATNKLQALRGRTK